MFLNHLCTPVAATTLDNWEYTGYIFLVVLLTLEPSQTMSNILDFKLSPCFESCLYSFGYIPGVWLWFADVSKHSICPTNSSKPRPQYKYHVLLSLTILHIQPLKMELIECSETLANFNQTPGKYPKEYRQVYFSRKSWYLVTNEISIRILTD